MIIELIYSVLVLFLGLGISGAFLYLNIKQVLHLSKQKRRERENKYIKRINKELKLNAFSIIWGSLNLLGYTIVFIEMYLAILLVSQTIFTFFGISTALLFVSSIFNMFFYTLPSIF